MEEEKRYLTWDEIRGYKHEDDPEDSRFYNPWLKEERHKENDYDFIKYERS